VATTVVGVDGGLAPERMGTLAATAYRDYLELRDVAGELLEQSVCGIACELY